jgi:hypothetical protein
MRAPGDLEIERPEASVWRSRLMEAGGLIVGGR